MIVKIIFKKYFGSWKIIYFQKNRPYQHHHQPETVEPIVFFIFLRIIGYLIAIRYILLPFARSYRVVPDIISLCQSKSYSISFSVTTALLSNKHIQINICRHNNSRIFIYLFPNIHNLYPAHDRNHACGPLLSSTSQMISIVTDLPSAGCLSASYQYGPIAS